LDLMGPAQRKDQERDKKGKGKNTSVYAAVEQSFLITLPNQMLRTSVPAKALKKGHGTQ